MLTYKADQVPPDERTNRIGLVITRGGIVTLDAVVPEYFKAIHVGIGGDLIVLGKNGNYIPFYAVPNSTIIYVMGNSVVSAATVDGVAMTTTATGITWHGGI